MVCICYLAFAIFDFVLFMAGKIKIYVSDFLKRLIICSDYALIAFSAIYIIYIFTRKTGIYSLSSTRVLLTALLSATIIWLIIQLIWEYKYGVEMVSYSLLDSFIILFRIIIAVCYIVTIILGLVPNFVDVSKKELELEKIEYERIDFIGALDYNSDGDNKRQAVITFKDSTQVSIDLGDINFDKIDKYENKDVSYITSILNEFDNEKKYYIKIEESIDYETLFGIKQSTKNIKYKIHTTDFNEYALINLLKHEW